MKYVYVQMLGLIREEYSDSEIIHELDMSKYDFKDIIYYNEYKHIIWD
mgnify:CR=1 FL=1